MQPSNFFFQVGKVFQNFQIEAALSVPVAQQPVTQKTTRAIARAILSEESVAKACEKENFKEIRVLEGGIEVFYTDQPSERFSSKLLKKNAQSAQKLFEGIPGTKRASHYLSISKSRDPFQYSEELKSIKKDLSVSIERLDKLYKEKKLTSSDIFNLATELEAKIANLVALHRGYDPKAAAESKNIPIDVNPGGLFTESKVSLDGLYQKMLNIFNSYKAQKRQDIKDFQKSINDTRELLKSVNSTFESDEPKGRKEYDFVKFSELESQKQKELQTSIQALNELYDKETITPKQLINSIRSIVGNMNDFINFFKVNVDMQSEKARSEQIDVPQGNLFEKGGSLQLQKIYVGLMQATKDLHDRIVAEGTEDLDNFKRTIPLLSAINDTLTA